MLLFLVLLLRLLIPGSPGSQTELRLDTEIALPMHQFLPTVDNFDIDFPKDTNDSAPPCRGFQGFQGFQFVCLPILLAASGIRGPEGGSR